ncbi:MAG: hypothetical protein PHY26_00970 [Bacilli bacterium]|jgi:hypothetical protein|nr:hypothetical protein [Bacilli bacterium]
MILYKDLYNGRDKSESFTLEIINKLDIIKIPVKYLKVANSKRLSFGIILEIAYRDNVDGAKWIVQNKVAIGKNIADTLIDYFNKND